MRYFITICTLVLGVYTNQSLASEVRFEDLTIIVSSCDRYSSLWSPFFSSLFQNWASLKHANHRLPIMLIANELTYPDMRVQTIHNKRESSWSDNMLNALSQVRTKYVLVLLDDYWLAAPVKEHRVHELLQAVKNTNAAMVLLSNNNEIYHKGPSYTAVKNLNYMHKYARYKTSLQAAIWDKVSLQFLLRPGEDPWMFEIAGTIRSHGYPQPFLAVNGDPAFYYLNAVHQGHIEPQALEFLKANNIAFDYHSFPVHKKFNYKILYKDCKKHINKLYAFLKSPGVYCKADDIS